MITNFIVSILTIIVLSYILITNPGYPLYIKIIGYVIIFMAVAVLIASLRWLRNGI